MSLEKSLKEQTLDSLRRALKQLARYNGADGPTTYSSLEEAYSVLGPGWGCHACTISREDVEKLLDGYVLAFSDGEYCHYIALEKEGK